jgi:hypothetical protein
MKTVKILLAASLLALALGKVSAQVNVGSIEQSMRVTDPGESPGNGEGF